MSVRPGMVPPVLRATLVVALTLVAGCAAPPQKEMDQAEGAIATARAAGAPEYATQEFDAAETALRRSHDAVGQRDYRQALNHALDARERAQSAAREAADKKALARGQAERAVTAAELAVATAQQRLTAAEPPPAGRRTSTVTTAAQAALRTAVENAAKVLQEARSHVQAQRFDEALQAAGPVPERIREAMSAYDAATSAARAPRPVRRGR